MSDVAPTTANHGFFDLNGLVVSETEQEYLAQQAAEAHHRRLAPKKKYAVGEPYCEEICEMEPNKEVEIAEGFAMAAFTVDYLGRLATVHAVPYRVLHPEAYAKDRSVRHYEPNGCKKTIAYFFHFIMLVDFFALAPYYFRTITERLLPNFASSGTLRAFRLVRIFRVAPFYMHMVVSTKGVLAQSEKPHFMRVVDLSVIFNFLRLGDYAEGAPLFFTTLRASLPAILMSLLAMFCLTMMFGTLVYMAEHGKFKSTPEYPNGAFLVQRNHMDQTLVEPAHANIFMSMWYVMSDTTTMPTICMLSPATVMGEVVDVIVDYLALIVLTLPIAIIGRNFHNQYESFFRRWDEDDIVWSSEEEDNGHGLDDPANDYDVAVLKMAAGEEESKLPDSAFLKV